MIGKDARDDNGCPYLNLDDPRCARHHTLATLDVAFGQCLGAYRTCTIYHALQRSMTPITCHGEPLEPAFARV